MLTIRGILARPFWVRANARVLAPVSAANKLCPFDENLVIGKRSSRPVPDSGVGLSDLVSCRFVGANPQRNNPIGLQRASADVIVCWVPRNVRRFRGSFREVASVGTLRVFNRNLVRVRWVITHNLDGRKLVER